MLDNFSDTRMIMLIVAIGSTAILGMMAGRPWEVGGGWTVKPYLLVLALMGWFVFLVGSF